MCIRDRGMRAYRFSQGKRWRVAIARISSWRRPRSTASAGPSRKPGSPTGMPASSCLFRWPTKSVAPDACRGHVGPGASGRAVEVDRAARVLDHGGVKARRTRVERGPRDAEIGREPAHVQLLELAFPE